MNLFGGMKQGCLLGIFSGHHQRLVQELIELSLLLVFSNSMATHHRKQQQVHLLHSSCTATLAAYVDFLHLQQVHICSKCCCQTPRCSHVFGASNFTGKRFKPVQSHLSCNHQLCESKWVQKNSGIHVPVLMTASYSNVLCSSDMNPISAGTISRSSHHEIQSSHVDTFLKCEMHLLCVLKPQVWYYQILALREGDSLEKNKV